MIIFESMETQANMFSDLHFLIIKNHAITTNRLTAILGLFPQLYPIGGSMSQIFNRKGFLCSLYGFVSIGYIPDRIGKRLGGMIDL